MFPNRESNRSQFAPGLTLTALRGAFNILVHLREHRHPPHVAVRGYSTWKYSASRSLPKTITNGAYTVTGQTTIVGSIPQNRP